MAARKTKSETPAAEPEVKADAPTTDTAKLRFLEYLYKDLRDRVLLEVVNLARHSPDEARDARAVKDIATQHFLRACTAAGVDPQVMA